MKNKIILVGILLVVLVGCSNSPSIECAEYSREITTNNTFLMEDEKYYMCNIEIKEIGISKRVGCFEDSVKNCCEKYQKELLEIGFIKDVYCGIPRRFSYDS